MQKVQKDKLVCPLRMAQPAEGSKWTSYTERRGPWVPVNEVRATRPWLCVHLPAGCHIAGSHIPWNNDLEPNMLVPDALASLHTWYP